MTAPRPRLSVVIPAYREEAVLGATVRALREAVEPIAEDGGAEIVVSDDGSDDATVAAAERAGADVVVTLDRHRGKGAAVRNGMRVARGQTVAFTDADLAYPPEQLARFLKEVESGADVAVGSRRHVDTVTLVRARRLREVTGRGFNAVTRALLLGDSRDTQCGIKAFSADAATAIFSRSRIDGFAFDVEVFVLARQLGLAVVEVPVELSNTATSTVRVGRDTVLMVRDVARIRWAARRRRDPGPRAVRASL